MDQSETYNKIVKLITPYVKNTAALEAANSSTRILEDLQVNSARLVDIILAIEDEFSVAIDDEAADRVQTLGDAVEVVLARSAVR